MCKSGQHSELSRSNAGPTRQVTQSSLISIQINQPQQGPPERRVDQDFTQRDIESVSAKKKLNQDKSSPPKQTQMLTKRGKGEVRSSQSANQSQNSSSTEHDGNQDPSKRKAEEKQVLVKMVMKQEQQQQQKEQQQQKQQQQKPESCPRTGPNQLQEPQETKPTICKHIKR